MGAAMAANIRRAGHPLVVWNRSPDKAATLLDLGAKLAETPAAAAADADIVISSLADGEADAEDAFAGRRVRAKAPGDPTMPPFGEQ